MNCIQLEDPCLPPVFSSFRKCFKVAQLGQRAEGRYDLVAVLATTHHERQSRSPSTEKYVCSICDSGDSIRNVSKRNSSLFLPKSI